MTNCSPWFHSLLELTPPLLSNSQRQSSSARESNRKAKFDYWLNQFLSDFLGPTVKLAPMGAVPGDFNKPPPWCSLITGMAQQWAIHQGIVLVLGKVEERQSLTCTQIWVTPFKARTRNIIKMFADDECREHPGQIYHQTCKVNKEIGKGSEEIQI